MFIKHEDSLTIVQRNSTFSKIDNINFIFLRNAEKSIWLLLEFLFNQTEIELFFLQIGP